MRAPCLLVPLLGACTFTVGTGPGSGGPDGSAAAAPVAVISATPDFVGLRTALDGSASADPAGRMLSYAWSIVSAPAGSAVTGSGTSPTFTFVADRGGDYVVALTVTNPDGTPGSATRTVTVPTLPVFYRQESIGRPADGFAFAVVRSDGSGAHALTCPVTIADPTGDGGAGNKGNYGDTPEGIATRVFYGPSTILAAFEEVGANATRLLVTDEHGDCTAAPARRLDADDAAQHLVPRFSPDGARVAWIEDGGAPQLVTAAVDGSARHVVRAGGAVKREPPLWLDAGHVAWLEDLGSAKVPHLQLVSAADSDGAGDGSSRAVLIDCDRAADPSALGVINQLERAGTAWIVAGGVRGRFDSPPGAIALYRLAGNSCSSTAATTLAPAETGGFAWDFALSPDGSTLALAAQEASGSLNDDLFLVPVDGSVPPSRFVGSAPGLDDVGPIWVAGGKQLLWTQVDASAHSGGVLIANRDGSNVRVLVAPAAGAPATYVGGATSRGLDCAAAGPRVLVGDAALIALALFLARRRRATDTDG